jgi:hypothetical protein
MRQQERQRARPLTTLVNEVDTDAVDHDAPVVEAVDERFGGTPVVPLAPVVDQLTQEAGARAVVPARVSDLLRPAGPFQPSAQIVETSLWDRDRQWL